MELWSNIWLDTYSSWHMYDRKTNARRFDATHNILRPLSLAQFFLKDRKTPVWRCGNRGVNCHYFISFKDANIPQENANSWPFIRASCCFITNAMPPLISPGQLDWKVWKISRCGSIHQRNALWWPTHPFSQFLTTCLIPGEVFIEKWLWKWFKMLHIN